MSVPNRETFAEVLSRFDVDSLPRDRSEEDILAACETAVKRALDNEPDWFVKNPREWRDRQLLLMAADKRARLLA